MNKTLEIKTTTGSGYTGYLALPDAKKGPGILLIQEVFGVNSHIRDVANLYAAAGYVVLAPDLFWRQQPNVDLGYTPEDIDKGRALAGKTDPEQILADLLDAVKALKKVPECGSRVGTVGFCMGGLHAYRLATHDAVDAAVSYYGAKLEQRLDEAKDLHCPLMLHLGGQDHMFPPETVSKISDGLRGKGHVEIFVYPDANHGFNCDQRPSYNRFASMLAYGRSQIFLHKMLS